LLRRYRQRALLTQEDLATTTGVSARTIRRLEANQLRRPRTATIRALASRLGLTAAEQATLVATLDEDRPQRSPAATCTGQTAGVPAPGLDGPRPTEPAPPRHDPAVRGPAGPGADSVPSTGTAIVAAPARSGTPAASRPRAAQLPADVPAFTGRVEHLRQLDALLGDAAGGPRAVMISAITGTAGVGKTALAVHWAHRVRDRFPDGQLHIDLQGFAPTGPLRPIDALTRFLHALGAPRDQVPVDEDEAASMYRSLLTDKRVLILLDNAGNADQIRPLLPASPACFVLVTSRNRLTGLAARDGARRIDLGLLTADEAGTLLARIVEPERVRAEPGACAEAARACAYLPLALRIAAAHIAEEPHLSIAEYVARLTTDNRITALSVVDDDQAAVRATFDLSYQHLPREAQRVFRLLGLAPGRDITADAAAALVAADDVDRVRITLDRLTAGHLLDQQSPGRYSFHDLLRHYATERARADDSEADRQAAVRRLLSWYLRTADGASRLLYPAALRLPPAGGEATAQARFTDHSALAWLEAERVNLVAAARHAARHGPRRIAWLLTDALRGYFSGHLHLIDWLTAAHAAAAAAEAEGDLTGQSVAQLNLADPLRRLSRYEDAIEHYHRTLALSREVGWLDGQATALANISGAHLFLGRLPQAAYHLNQALRIDRQTGRRAGEASRLNNLGVVHWQMGQLGKSAQYYREALTLQPTTGVRLATADSLSNLAEVYHALGQFDAALDHVNDALDLYRRAHDQGDADALRILACVHRDAGRYGEALDHAQNAIALACDTAQDPRTEAHALVTLGTIRQRLGQYETATELHQRALHVAAGTGNRFPQTEALIGLATVHLKRNQPEQAADRGNEAVAIACNTGYRMLEGQALTALAEVHLDRHRIDRAVDRAQEALAIHQETGHRIGEAHTLLALGRALAASTSVDAAISCRRRALRILNEIGAPQASYVRTLLVGDSWTADAAPTRH
jgi:tetratricopeptide (TPR) repeat protein/transcriptional regulator with XRE-family HTH domain